MDVYLIRHTPPALGAGICYGRLDVDLAAGCETSMAALAERLKPPAGVPAGAPVVAPRALRCQRLAAVLAAALDSRIVIEDRLRELDFGDWEGLDWDAIPSVQTDVWARDIWSQSAPGGESYAALHERVGAAWESLLGGREQALLVVCPAGPLRALLTIALELPADAFMRIHVDYGGIAKLSDATGGWRLDFSNR